MAERLKVAAVGAGKIGLRHQKAYVENPRSELVAVCDMVEEKAKARANELRVPRWYTSLDDMLAQEECNLVDVVTADTLHYEPVMKCLEHRKHVICEKPLAMNVDEAEKMVAKAEETGVQLAINYNRRYAPGYAKAREWFDAGECGEVAYIDMKLSQNGPAFSKKGEYYLLYELLNHAVDLFRWFAGDIAGVTAEMGKSRRNDSQPEGPACWTSMAIGFRFAGGAVATLLGSWESDFTHPIERFEVCGNVGEIVVDNIIDGATLMRRDNQIVEEYRPSIFKTGQHIYADTFAPRIDALVDDLLAGKAPAPLGRDGLQSLRVVDAIIRSWEERREIAPAGANP